MSDVLKKAVKLNHSLTPDQFWSSGIVVASVCLCVCVSKSVCQSPACPLDINSGPVQP